MSSIANMIHTAKVKDRRIHWDNREIVQHGINSDAIKLDLDPEFSGLDRIEVWLTTDAIAPEAFEVARDGLLVIPERFMEVPGRLGVAVVAKGEGTRIVMMKSGSDLMVTPCGQEVM